MSTSMPSVKALRRYSLVVAGYVYAEIACREGISPQAVQQQMVLVFGLSRGSGLRPRLWWEEADARERLAYARALEGLATPEQIRTAFDLSDSVYFRRVPPPTKSERALNLWNLGFSRAAIAAHLNTSSGSIGVMLAVARARDETVRYAYAACAKRNERRRRTK